MIARRALQVAALFTVVATVLLAFDALGVGLNQPVPTGESAQSDLVAGFEAAEEAYLLWGRWGDLSVALVFASLVVAAPMLPAADKAKHVLVSGASIVVVGELIDLSQQVGIRIARFSLDNELIADFTAGNVLRVGINSVSAWVFAGGLVLTSLGVAFVAQRASGRWRMVCWVFSVILLVAGIADVTAGGLALLVSYFALAVGGLLWIWVALRELGRTRSDQVLQ